MQKIDLGRPGAAGGAPGGLGGTPPRPENEPEPSENLSSGTRNRAPAVWYGSLRNVEYHCRSMEERNNPSLVGAAARFAKTPTAAEWATPLGYVYVHHLDAKTSKTAYRTPQVSNSMQTSKKNIA